MGSVIEKRRETLTKKKQLTSKIAKFKIIQFSFFFISEMLSAKDFDAGKKFNSIKNCSTIL